MTRSKEDYLEAILIVISQKGACRVTDIAKQMGVSKASTSAALKRLEEDSCIVKDDWRILLTEQGRTIAEKVYEKHKFFCKLFQLMGVSASTATEDACRIEHILSDETCQKIREYIDNQPEIKAKLDADM